MTHEASIKYSKRHTEILRILREEGTSTIADLARQLQVSQESIRRDVRPLTERGDLLKLHGAVSLTQQLAEAPFQKRMRINAEGKRLIARCMADRIENGDSLMLDTGTTTSMVARALLDKKNLTILTNSTDIARTLAGNNNNKVYQAGGEMRADNSATFGSFATRFMQQFHVKHSIISIGAIDSKKGAQDYNIEEAEFARTVLSCGEVKTIVADSSKFNRTGLVKVCELKEIDCLIVNSELPDELPAIFQEAGIEMIYADNCASLISKS